MSKKGKKKAYKKKQQAADKASKVDKAGAENKDKSAQPEQEEKDGSCPTSQSSVVENESLTATTTSTTIAVAAGEESTESSSASVAVSPDPKAVAAATPTPENETDQVVDKAGAESKVDKAEKKPEAGDNSADKKVDNLDENENVTTSLSAEAGAVASPLHIETSANVKTSTKLSPDAKPFEMTTTPTMPAAKAPPVPPALAKIKGFGPHSAPAKLKLTPRKSVPTATAVAALPGPDYNNMKHPLEFPWTFWYFSNNNTVSWEMNLRPVHTVSYAEDFWAMYNMIMTLSELPHGCDYSFFKKGIKPMWEDRENAHGGRWIYNSDRQCRSSVLDKVWLDVLLFLIGGMVGRDRPGLSREVNGAVVNLRAKGDKLALWLRDSRENNSLTEIGKMYKEVISRAAGARSPIAFEEHRDSKQRVGSMSKYAMKL